MPDKGDRPVGDDKVIVDMVVKSALTSKRTALGRVMHELDRLSFEEGFAEIRDAIKENSQ